MNSDKTIFPILKIKSNRNILNIHEINENDIKDFGNGFFLSANGKFATAYHVIEESNGYKYFALVENELYKIDKLPLKKPLNNHRQEIDVAIGNIDFETEYYYDPLEFGEVKQGSKLLIKGFIRELFYNFQPQKSFLFSKSKYYFYEVETTCEKTVYPWQNHHHDEFIMTDSYLITNLPELDGWLYGLSGSPVFNRNNQLVGFLKGGKDERGSNHARVIHINYVKKMFDVIEPSLSKKQTYE